MFKAIIILILYCLIGFGVGLCIGQYSTKSSLHGGTDNNKVYFYKE